MQPGFLAEMCTLLISLAGAILLYLTFRERYLVPWIAGTAFGVAKLFTSLIVSPALHRFWMELAQQAGLLADLLIPLAGAILLYLTFRERYLVPWIGGWTAFGAAKLFTNVSPASHGFWMWLSYCAFVVAVGLFSSAVFLYTQQRKFLWLTGGLLLLALALDALRRIWFPGMPLRVFDFLSWYLALVIASVHLARFAWGRLNLGRWLLAITLLLLHFDPLLHFDALTTSYRLGGFEILVDLLLGISMMMIVLDDSRVQILQLRVLNAVTQQTANSQDFKVTLEAVLKELAKTTKAKAAWFRMLEGDDLVLEAQQGVSEAFVNAAKMIDIRKSISEYALRQSEVCTLDSKEALPELRGLLKAESVHHLVLVPVEGKSSRVGMLVMGLAHFRTHTETEKSFLRAAANQLGLAAENRKLVRQVVQSKSEWASTFDSIADFIFVHDQTNRILRANRALLRKLDLPADEVNGHFCEEVLPGARAGWTGCPYCVRIEWGVGADPCFGGYSVVSTSVHAGEDASQSGKVHVIKDITAAKAAEERYASLFSQMHEGVFTSTPEGRILDCNEAFVTMLGYSSKAEILALDVAEALYVDPDHRERFLGEMLRHGFVRNFEYRLQRKDGQEINVMESSFATRDATGNLERYQGVVLDVTEMKRAEEEIRRRNRELYVLNNIAVAFNQSFDLDEILQLSMLQIVELLSTDTAAVYLTEGETNTLIRKAAFGYRSTYLTESETFELPADFVEAVRREHAEIIDQEHLPNLPEMLQKIVQDEGLRSWMWVVLWRKEKVFGVLTASSRIARKFTPSEESVMIAVGRQLATTVEKAHLYQETKKAYEDLRRTQEQLLQSEKMSAVGQLISGVAHELNNPLTAVLGYAQLLESEHLEPRGKEFVQKLRKQTLRTQKIVQNLLSFGRQHKPTRVHVDLRTVMEDTIALRDYDLKVNNITVQRDFEPVLPSVVADPHQLEQVYLNIINNAADAMLDGGRGGRLHIRIFTEDGYIISEFHDSGPGMAEPKHVFDPFYTTKRVGKGTGLGLSICYGIVKEHGGEISASNHGEGGALLQVRLPVAVGEKPVTERERIVARRESRLEGRVLLVDDEEAVLDFEREVLAAAGVSVVTATSGARAMERINNEEFDAVFLDSKLPGEWSSEDVYHWIENSHPVLIPKTIFVLSDISDSKTRAFVHAAQILCLVKPFEVADLLAIARRVVRKAKAAARS